MGSIVHDEYALPSFRDVFPHFHSHPSTLSSAVDPFTITALTGFMPLHTPLADLPQVFKKVQLLAEAMPILKLSPSTGDNSSGKFEPGLLAEGNLGSALMEFDNYGNPTACKLPDLTDEIDKLRTPQGHLDLPAITAVFRDYTFIASAYLLEPCWVRHTENPGQGFGLGRAVLPKAIAGPLTKAAEILDIPAFMSYAASYALYNYRLIDPDLGASVYDNLRLIRAFEKGLDPKSSEAGFILTHVHMVQETGPLVAGAVSLLESIADHGQHLHIRNDATTANCVSAFQTLLTAMTRIENHMEKMWAHSLPKDYNIYRTFIFGITNQSMFPNGVIYEGINGDQPQFFRGESGANDSIIPLLDSLLQIPMPTNPLTKILHEFRSYRPKPHRHFLAYVRSTAETLGVKEFCASANHQDLAVLFLRLLDHVRSFRWRHWLFAREYIIKRTRHPTATGGSPIVTWLPNQIFAVMEYMEDIWQRSGLEYWQRSTRGANNDETNLVDESEREDVVAENIKIVREIMENVRDQRRKLRREVDKYCSERDAAASVAPESRAASVATVRG